MLELMEHTSWRLGTARIIPVTLGASTDRSTEPFMTGVYLKMLVTYSKMKLPIIRLLLTSCALANSGPLTTLEKLCR